MRNLSIAARIILGFALILLLLLTASLMSRSQLFSLEHTVQNTLQQNLPFVRAMTATRQHVANLRRYEKDSFINIGNPEKVQEYRGKWDKAMEQAEATLAGADSTAPDEARAQLGELKQRLASYRDGYKAVYQQLAAGQFASSGDANHALNQYKDAVRGMEGILGNLAKLSEQHVDAMTDQIRASSDHARDAQLLLTALSIVLGSVLAVFVVLSIRRPLALINVTTQQLASTRDLTRPLPDLGHNEIGRVSQALGSLVNATRELVSESHHHSARLLDDAHSLRTVSHDITEAARNQTAAASASAAAIEELTVSVSIVADSAQGLEQQAHAAHDQAARGDQLAQQTAADISQIAASIASASQRIDQLDRRSSEIGDIVQVIHDIAEQTNLLALNAAIEAARAGETGRGFAVVADEVRKLAERTDQATSEIKSCISAVQQDTRAAVASMRQANSQVDSGVSAAQRVTEALAEIRGLNTQSVEKISEIADAIKEQSHASQDIARNVEQIAQMNESTQHAVHQAASLASTLTALAGELDASLKRFTV